MLKGLQKKLLHLGYLEKPRESHVLQLQIFIMTLIFLSNQLILPNRAQEAGDPSYYYKSCAPSTCNGFTLTAPLAVGPFCHPSDLAPFCDESKENETLLFTDVQSRKSYRVLPTKNFTAPLADPAVTTVSYYWAYNPFFSCGPISEANYTDPQPHEDIFYSSHSIVGTHLNCTIPIPIQGRGGLQKASCLGCPGQDLNNVCYYAQGFASYPNCETYRILTPFGFNVSAEKDLRGYLKRGHVVIYVKPVQCRGCQASGGRCGFSPSSSSSSFVCFCPSTVHPLNCSDGMIVDITTWAASRSRRSSGPRKALIIAVVSASASVVFLALLTFLIFKMRHRMKLKKEVISNISPSRYSYSQIKMFTNNLSTKLGEGAYGSVYKGVIHQNGVDVVVAVKLLKSKQSEKQFINEVATTGAVHHQHLVSLLGYCARGRRHALVYEFMERGSLDKYIYTSTRKGGNDEEEKTDFERLSYKHTYAIALQTAKGILYLHQGCRHRILHFDIKPHNVLLDSNFTAKVADFGLSRMMGEDHSHVSLTRARGTPGYVAPEIWLKTHGPVTEKSDVYSYGMMLLEIVGRRKNCDPEANESSQVYFPIWAYNRVKVGEMPLLPPMKMREEEVGPFHEVEGDERDGGEEELIIKRMCLVGLWCIQHIPSNRPSMDRVIQMLEGNVEVEIPPHPFPHLTAENVEDNSNKASVPFSVSSVSWSLEPR